MHIIRVYRIGAWAGPIVTYSGLHAEEQLRQSGFINDPTVLILR